ncbi:MAG: hypothetical protein KGZ30_03185 [Anaplasmataceae bacterium]|nr:hypothetical protein [Anaplasmataceae bacterium]
MNQLVPQEHHGMWFGVVMALLLIFGVLVAYKGDINAIMSEANVTTVNSETSNNLQLKINQNPASIQEVAEPYLFLPKVIFQLQ